MLHRLQGSLFGLRRRLAAVGSGFVDTFLRDKKIIALVMALLALLVFAWIVAGVFLGGPEKGPASKQASVAQSQNSAGTSNPPAPEVEHRNVESYAAYQFKDPFRQLLAPAESTTATTTPETTSEATIPESTSEETTGGGTATNRGAGRKGGGGGGNRGGRGGGLYNSGGDLPLP